MGNTSTDSSAHPGIIRSAGHTFTRPFHRTRGDKTVMVNVGKVNASFAKNPTYFIGTGGKGGIANRYAEAQAHISAGRPIAMPQVTISGGNIQFSDGRHRFAALRDKGVTAIPVSVPAKDAATVAKLFS